MAESVTQTADAEKGNGVTIMNTDVNNTHVIATETTTKLSNRDHTLKTLFNVICVDNEFSLLRRTLELYCEEIERKMN